MSRRRGRRARSGLSKANRDGLGGCQARGAQGGDRRAKGTPGVRAARRERGVAAARAGANRAMHHAGGLPNVSLFFIISVWAIRLTSCFLLVQDERGDFDAADCGCAVGRVAASTAGSDVQGVGRCRGAEREERARRRECLGVRVSRSSYHD